VAGDRHYLRASRTEYEALAPSPLQRSTLSEASAKPGVLANVLYVVKTTRKRALFFIMCA